MAGELICIAQIKGAFGVKGEVRIRSFTDIPSACFSYGPLLDEKGDEVLIPKQFRAVKDGFIVVSYGNETRENWEALKGQRLYTQRESLPVLEGEDEFYFQDLIGLDVIDMKSNVIGKVKSVFNFGAEDILEITGDFGVMLVPFTKALFPEIALAEKTVFANPDPVYFEPYIKRLDISGNK